MPIDELVLGVVAVDYPAVRNLVVRQSKQLTKMLLHVVDHLRPLVCAEATQIECFVLCGASICIHTRTVHELSRFVLVTRVIRIWRVFRPRNHRAIGVQDLFKL